MIAVIAKCPGCNKTIAHEGKYLDGVELATKEAWVIECQQCHKVFLYDIQDTKNGGE